MNRVHTIRGHIYGFFYKLFNWIYPWDCRVEGCCFSTYIPEGRPKEKAINWDFDSDTDMMVASREYNSIYLKRGRTMLWWVIQSDVDTESRMILRDPDLHDLKDIFAWLINEEPLRLSNKYREMKRKSGMV